jgi:hypothetical protein
MYEKVENKVIFGDFESDWFDQEFGLKQGCVLSPTLFSILMTDLANMQYWCKYFVKIDKLSFICGRCCPHSRITRRVTGAFKYFERFCQQMEPKIQP